MPHMAFHKPNVATNLQRMAVASTSFRNTRCYTAHHATATATLNPSNRACQMRQQKGGTATTSQTIQLFFRFQMYTLFSHEALACTCNAYCTTPNTEQPQNPDDRKVHISYPAYSPSAYKYRSMQTRCQHVPPNAPMQQLPKVPAACLHWHRISVMTKSFCGFSV